MLVTAARRRALASDSSRTESHGERRPRRRRGDGARVRGHQRRPRRGQLDRHARDDPCRAPGPGGVLAAVGNVLGPLLIGRAVANTIAGIVTVPDAEVIVVLGAALTGAVAWNLITWWRGLPSSSGHALLGGLVGAALVGGRDVGRQLGRLRRDASRRRARRDRGARDRARPRARGRDRRRPRRAVARASCDRSASAVRCVAGSG